MKLIFAKVVCAQGLIPGQIFLFLVIKKLVQSYLSEKNIVYLLEDLTSTCMSYRIFLTFAYPILGSKTTIKSDQQSVS